MGVKKSSAVKFVISESVTEFVEKYRRDIEDTINDHNGNVDIMEMNSYPDHFLVKIGKYFNKLDREQKLGKVLLIGYIPLSPLENPNQHSHYAIWKRLKSSEILN
jgi:hypothetical protein